MTSRTINLDQVGTPALLGTDINEHVIFQGTGTSAINFTLFAGQQDGNWVELFNFSKHAVTLVVANGQHGQLSGPGTMAAYSGSGAVPRLRLLWLQGYWHHG